MFYACNCGGQHQESFKHPLTKVIIKIYHKSQKFTARNRNSIIKQGLLNELETFVPSLFQ